MSTHCASCNALSKGHVHVPILLERLGADLESDSPLCACAACGQEWMRSDLSWCQVPMMRRSALPLAA